METKGPEWLGLELIRDSELRKRGKYTYASRWRGWVSWCDEMGVNALAATADDALQWVRHEERSQSMVKETKKAVSLVYRALGMGSPFRERQVMRALFPDSGRYGGEEGYSDFARECHSHRVCDYLVWCQQGGRSALPGSGRQVAEFLLAVAEEYSYSMVEQASAGVSRYLEDNGCPGTSHHPAVQQALKDCQALCSGRTGAGHRKLRDKTTTQRDVLQAQWKTWCTDQGIDWKRAGEDDALRYLRGLEYQRTAGLRVHQLSLLYEGMGENPFASERVGKWRSEHVRRMRENPAEDWRVNVRAEEVIQEAQAAKELQPARLAVGLTLDDVEGLDDDLSGEYADRTLKTYGQHFAGFEAWLLDLGVSLDQVVDQHVGVINDNKECLLR